MTTEASIVMIAVFRFISFFRLGAAEVAAIFQAILSLMIASIAQEVFFQWKSKT
jgi:hypothetical protein